jgi:hypothetical protein
LADSGGIGTLHAPSVDERGDAPTRPDTTASARCRPATTRSSCSASGSALERRAVSVAAGGTIRADFALREAATTVAPVVISATREMQRRCEASVTIDVLDGLL